MSSILYNKPKIENNKNDLFLLRVVIDEKYTKIDFGYQATDHYIRGGWVTMNPYAFIRIKGSNEKLTLTRVENIPLEPTKLNFKSTVESLYFSLFFPPLPNKSLVFDFIEKEPYTDTLFDLYGITINKKEGIPFLNKK